MLKRGMGMGRSLLLIGSPNLPSRVVLYGVCISPCRVPGCCWPPCTAIVATLFRSVPLPSPACLFAPSPLPPQVSPSYAPPGQSLVSVSTVGTFDDLSDAQLEAAVREQLSKWFGARNVEPWSLLRIYRIPFAQPNQVNREGGGGKEGGGG